jgi:AraC-like DNA-binding protein
MRLLVLSSDTLRIAIDRLLHYQRFWNEGERYQLEERRRTFLVRYRTWGPARTAHVQVAEKTAAQLASFVRYLVPGQAPAAVRFPHARRQGDEEVGRVLGCEPEFERDCTEIEFPLAVLDARVPTADRAVFQVLDRQLADRLRAISPASPFSDRVRKAIADYLHDDHLSMKTVARILGSSERTLHRRLTDEATSFRALVDEVRRSRAITFLEHGASVPELALVLGYAEVTAFYRAFKRWTGTTPERWRSAGTST